MAAISTGILKYGRLGAVTGILIALGDSVNLWYTGPAVPVVVAVVGAVVGYFKTKYQAEKLLDEGLPILFSQDENDG
jgi:membrane protein DedA with SNARE-associated domain